MPLFQSECALTSMRTVMLVQELSRSARFGKCAHAGWGKTGSGYAANSVCKSRQHRCMGRKITIRSGRAVIAAENTRGEAKMQRTTGYARARSVPER
jgi:hypothetical protein